MGRPLKRLTDLFLALPFLPLLSVVIMLFREPLKDALGPNAGIFILVVSIIGITSWMQTARVVRTDVLDLKEREFVLAARSIGTRRRRIIGRHVLPNVMNPVMVAAALGVAVAILTVISVNFIGDGIRDALDPKLRSR